MHTPVAKKLGKTTLSQDIAPNRTTLTGNSGPVSEYFVSGELTGKERDPETGLYYYGARYLDPRTSRWLSVDPAMGEYIPLAPINDDAKKHNENLPGMGGIFNYVNFHVYHYAGNNPVKLIDPDGRDFYNLTNYDIVVKSENEGYALVRPGEVFRGKIDGAVILETETVIKVSALECDPAIHVFAVVNNGEVAAYLLGTESININDRNDALKALANNLLGRQEEYSGIYENEAVQNYPGIRSWVSGAREYYSNNGQTPGYVSQGVGRMTPRESRGIRNTLFRNDNIKLLKTRK